MSDHEQHDDGHHGSNVGKFVMVFFALCILTTISFIVGNSEALMQNTPAIGRFLMIAVSCAKALLVILFFMHLKWEANWKYVLTIPASMMSIFLLVMLTPDIGCRYSHYSEERLLFAADPETSDHDSHTEAGHAGDAAEEHPTH